MSKPGDGDGSNSAPLIPPPPIVVDPSRPGSRALMGNTPLVPLREVNPNPKVEIYAKIENNNPGGSVKDRPALWMVEAAERP
jgi:hypothetical protein